MGDVKFPIIGDLRKDPKKSFGTKKTTCQGENPQDTIRKIQKKNEENLFHVVC